MSKSYFCLRLYMMSLFSQVVSNGVRLWNRSHWEHWYDNSLHGERRQEKKEETESDVNSTHMTCWLIFIFCMVYVFVFDTVYVFVFFWQAWWRDWVLCPTHMLGLSFHSYFAFLYFCLCVSLSLILSVLVFFDKPDGGTESDVHPTCWVWDEGGVEATFPLNFVIIVIWITTNHNSSSCWNHLSPIPIVFGYSHQTSSVTRLTFNHIAVVIFRLRAWCGGPEKWV